MKNPPVTNYRPPRQPKSRFWLVLGRTVVTLFFTAITLGAAAFLFPRQVLTIDSGDQQADALVVLGGEGGRAERAAELYRQGAAPAVIVTGHGDCQANVTVLEQNGVPASAITAEPTALTTWENASFSIPILRRMGAKRAIVVTSWYHSRRAMACFEHFAPDIQFYSRPSYFEYVPETLTRKGYSEHVDIEYLKILVYWFKHGVAPF